MRLPLTLALLTLAATTPAQTPADEAAIRSTLARETEGWAKYDAKEVASAFTDDLIWQNPFGVRLHGKAEFEKFLNNLLARPGYRAGKDTQPTTVLDLRFTSPTTAVAWSDERLENVVNDFSGNTMPPRHSFYLEVLVKRNNTWAIRDAMVMDTIHPK